MTPTNRSKYLEYLPAIFQEHPYLGEFLLPFEEILTGYEHLLSDVDRFWTPMEDTASLSIDADYLPWLASWVALVLDEEWVEEKKRELISEAVRLYQQRGTLPGLKRYLEIYTGLVPEIRECLWPSGFQIGVASQVGGFIPNLPKEQTYPMIVTEMIHKDPVVYYDYYVVYEASTQYYYRVDRVEKIVFAG
jgi:phage tail-like protein